MHVGMEEGGKLKGNAVPSGMQRGALTPKSVGVRFLVLVTVARRRRNLAPGAENLPPGALSEAAGSLRCEPSAWLFLWCIRCCGDKVKQKQTFRLET